MNITETMNTLENNEMIRTCSRISNSTASSLGIQSPKSQDLPTSFFIPSLQTEKLDKKEAQLENQSSDRKLQNMQSQMDENCETLKMCEQVQEKQTEPYEKESLAISTQIPKILDISIYMKKRSKIMQWIQSYSSQLCLSKSSTSLAHQFTDIYFHSFPLQQVQLTLTAILILSSKNCDHKVLYTSHTAYICDLDLHQLNNKQLHCLANMDGNLPNFTYAKMVDLAFWELRQFCNFYKEGLSQFLTLNMAHGIVENLYINFYEWEPNMQDIRYALLLALKKYSPNQLIPYLQKHVSPILPEYHIKIDETGQQWINKNEQNYKQIFENRKKNEQYTNYSQFCIKYFNF